MIETKYQKSKGMYRRESTEYRNSISHMLNKCVLPYTPLYRINSSQQRAMYGELHS